MTDVTQNVINTIQFILKHNVNLYFHRDFIFRTFTSVCIFKKKENDMDRVLNS